MPSQIPNSPGFTTASTPAHSQGPARGLMAQQVIVFAIDLFLTCGMNSLPSAHHRSTSRYFPPPSSAPVLEENLTTTSNLQREAQGDSALFDIRNSTATA